MKTNPCPTCRGAGRYADALTNWDSVPCWRCDGTGLIPDVLTRVVVRTWTSNSCRPLIDPAKVAAMRAQLAALGGRS